VTSVSFLSPALAEIADAAAYYQSHAPEAAEGFFESLDAGVDLLANHPYAGRPTRFEARRLTLRKYPYDLVYRIYDEGVLVTAVAHHRRKPWYWADRMP
jgi:plasmid stabilization system protein ParE